MTISTSDPRWPRWTGALVLTMSVAAAIVTGRVTAANASRTQDTNLRSALAKRLPKTKITAVDCNKLTGLCEVSAGNTLFYADVKGRYLVIGRVYDMETRTDLTAAKLLELNPDTLLGAAAHNEPATGEGAIRTIPSKLSVAELPTAGAIRWGPTSGVKAVVFTDFHAPIA